MVTPVTPVMMVMILTMMLETPVFLYAMMISTMKTHHLTIARIVGQAVKLAVMVTPVTPVMMVMILTMMLETPVFLYAMMISTKKTHHLTIAMIV